MPISTPADVPTFLGFTGQNEISPTQLDLWEAQISEIFRRLLRGLYGFKPTWLGDIISALSRKIYMFSLHSCNFLYTIIKGSPYIINRKRDQCNQDIFPERKCFIYDIIKMQKYYINMKKSAWDWIKLCLALYISDNSKGPVKSRRPGPFSASKDLQAWGFQSSSWHSFF